MDINKYKIGHTIAKTYPGGFRLDLFNSMYQISFAVSADDNPPRTRANTTKGKTRYLLDKDKTIFF
jgi:hypothetical protein